MKVIKEYLDHKFSSNKYQSKDTSDVYYFKSPYIGNYSYHLKNKLSKLCKEFVKKILSLSLIHSKLKIIFHIKTQFLMPVYKCTCASCSSSCTGEIVVILKLGLRNISKRITSLIFLNIYTPPQHALTCIILFLLEKTTLNST